MTAKELFDIAVPKKEVRTAFQYCANYKGTQYVGYACGGTHIWSTGITKNDDSIVVDKIPGRAFDDTQLARINVTRLLPYWEIGSKVGGKGPIRSTNLFDTDRSNLCWQFEDGFLYACQNNQEGWQWYGYENNPPKPSKGHVTFIPKQAWCEKGTWNIMPLMLNGTPATYWNGGGNLHIVSMGYWWKNPENKNEITIETRDYLITAETDEQTVEIKKVERKADMNFTNIPSIPKKASEKSTEERADAIAAEAIKNMDKVPEIPEEKKEPAKKEETKAEATPEKVGEVEYEELNADQRLNGLEIAVGELEESAKTLFTDLKAIKKLIKEARKQAAKELKGSVNAESAKQAEAENKKLREENAKLRGVVKTLSNGL